MLRAAVIIDYQNIQTTGSQRFYPKDSPRKRSLNPTKFAEALVSFRNSRVADPALLASIEAIEVYRGLPSSARDPKDNARNLEEQRRWSHDRRVKVVHRPLKYVFHNRQDNLGMGTRYFSKVEKGIDVLCALAVVRNVKAEQIDLVILASHDSDLEPAIEEAVRISAGTVVETVSWLNPEYKNSRSRLNPKTLKPIWNTSLGREQYDASVD